MATIDIGKIKPVFKGTYDNSTAYVLDDIVYYNGSSYVAKTSTTGNLPTDTTKWNILASGSGGIYDSTLSIGSANQVLAVNSGATALEFQDASGGKTIQRQHTLIQGAYSVNSTSYAEFSGLPTFSITPSSSSNKILIQATFYFGCGNWGVGKLQRKIGSGSYADFNLSTNAQSGGSNNHFANFYDYNDGDIQRCFTHQSIDEPNTTDVVTYRLVAQSYNPTTIYLGRTITYSTGYTALGSAPSSVLLSEITT